MKNKIWNLNKENLIYRKKYPNFKVFLRVWKVYWGCPSFQSLIISAHIENSDPMEICEACQRPRPWRWLILLDMKWTCFWPRMSYSIHNFILHMCIYIYNLMFWILLRYQMIIKCHCLDACWVFVFPPTFKNLRRSYPHLGNKGLRNWWPQPAVWCSEWPTRPTVDGLEIRLTTWDAFETLWILEYLLHQLVQDFFQHKTFKGLPKQKRLRGTWIQHKHFQSYGRYLNE